MESETEEVDLVISKFIPLFECNLSERVDDNLSKANNTEQIRHICNTLDGSVDEDQNIFLSGSENLKTSLNDSPNANSNWISQSEISDPEYLVNPLVNKSMCIDDNDNISIKNMDKKYGADRDKEKCDKNVFIEKSQDICLYEYNLPILLDPVVENDKKFTKLFEKYGERENLYIESDRVMESSVLEEINEDEQNIEFERESSSKSYKDVKKREKNNNNTTFSKNYLYDKHDNEKYTLKNKSKSPSSESLPWTMKLRTRKKQIQSDLTVNDKLYSSESEEGLEFENDKDEWTPGNESERQVTDSDNDIQRSTHFVPNKTSNIVGKKQSNVIQTSVSPCCSKPQGSRQNLRTSSTSKETIHYCHYPGCHMYFNRPSKLLIHGRTHTGERPFVCSIKGCERTYTRQSHLQRHMIRSHKPKDTDHTKQCEKCGKNFADIYSMQKHVTRYHVRREYACDVCSKVFKKHQHLKSHSYLHTGIQPYECQHPGCDMRFMNPSKLKRHSRIHEIGRYECSYETNGVVCGEKFDRHHDLRLHISYNHPKECDICGRQFKQKRSLRIHRSTHENVREAFFCPIPECDKFYYHNKNLTAHIRTSHEKSYIFECGACNVILATKQKLSDHMKIHEEGYQRNWSRSKPPKPRKDKGVSKTDITKLLSGYDGNESCTPEPESELEDMEIEEQGEIDDQGMSKNLSTDIEESYSNPLTENSSTIEHFGGLEYMEIDDKIQSVGISDNVNCLEINPQKSIESMSGVTNKDEYFPNSSQFTLLSANEDENSNDKGYKKDKVSNNIECGDVGNYDSSKSNQGRILMLVQGKSSSVSIKTKLG